MGSALAWLARRIGQKVSRYGLAFGMRVSAYDPYGADWVDNVFRCGSLPELLGNSDVLSIHVPLNDNDRVDRNVRIRALAIGFSSCSILLVC